MKVNGTVGILSKRTRIALRRFILDHGWPESARRLGMNQSYLQLVVRGRKPITNDLMRKLGMIITPQFATDTEADALFEQVFKGKSVFWKEYLND